MFHKSIILVKKLFTECKKLDKTFILKQSLIGLQKIHDT